MLATVLLVAALVAQPPSADFERGRTAFERGEYPRAIEILRPLLYPDVRLETEGQVVQAHRMLGVAHLFEKQNDLAAQEFRKLLQLRPDYRFDPLLDPPQVVDFFNGVLRDYEGEIAQMDARRKRADLEEQRQREAYERVKNGPTVIEKHFVRNSFSLNFVPFGTGQFQNGQRRKGWTFLISESALAAVSVGALTTNFLVYGFRARLPCQMTAGVDSAPCVADHTDERNSHLLTRVQVVSGGLFFAVAAWGIADAILHFKPESALPVEEHRIAPPAQSGVRLRVAPVLLAGGCGAGLAFRF